MGDNQHYSDVLAVNGIRMGLISIKENLLHSLSRIAPLYD